MRRLTRGLMAALLLSAVAATPAFAVPATVRVEGRDRTLLERTQVEVPTSGTFGPEGCPFGTAGGAIQVGTNGNWDQLRYTKLILGERHDFAEDGDYWALWVNNDYKETEGACDYVLQPGDEVLMVPDPGAATEPYIGRYPLGLRDVPRAARAGAPVTVTAVQYDNDARPTPAAGVTVTASDGQTATSGSDGKVTFSFGSGADITLKARRSGNGPSAAEPVCVTTGSDARCGSPAADGSTTTTGGTRTAGRDRQAPKALVNRGLVREGEVFRRGRGPRQLRGRAGVPSGGNPRLLADDPSGIFAVKLRLTRNDRGRCSAYSATRERFVRRPCGARHGWWFGVGERANWTYLLPARLPRGRYVLDVNAIDRAYNRDDRRRRGENRVVFVVR